MTDRIKLVRKNHGLTQQEFADRLRITRGAIANYEIGRNVPTDAVIALICREFNVSEEWLRTGTGDMYRFEDDDELAEIAARYGANDEAIELVRFVLSLDDDTQIDILNKLKALVSRSKGGVVPDTADVQETLTDAQKAAEQLYIRVYSTPAAAGAASPIEGEDYSIVRRDKKTPRNADYAVRIQGDSMEPYIKDGETVYVQQHVALRDLDVGIFFLDGDVLCKQIEQDSAGTIHLLSANPKREKLNRAIPKDSTSTLVCLGKVIMPGILPPPKYR